MAMKQDIALQIEAAVGDVAAGVDSVCGRVRLFYTNTYKSLDQFDQLWYECCYDKRDHAWQTCYTWAVILDSVVNARSAYCENLRSVEPLKSFVEELIKDIQESVKTI